jgi:hypothetical protein
MALRNRVVCRRPDGYWVQQRLEGRAEPDVSRRASGEEASQTGVTELPGGPGAGSQAN